MGRPDELCELVTYLGTQLGCVKNSNCTATNAYQEGICTCLPGFANVRNEFCMPLLGLPCDLKDGIEACAPGRYLTCAPEGICGCNSDTILDTSLGQCIIKVGKPCNEFHSTDICVSHAVCVEGVCQCTNGLEETRDGECRLGHLQRCIPWEFRNDCNLDSKLYCINQTCSCQVGQDFEATRGKCLGLVGSECEVEFNDCVPESQCIPASAKTAHGICTSVIQPEIEIPVNVACAAYDFKIEMYHHSYRVLFLFLLVQLLIH